MRPGCLYPGRVEISAIRSLTYDDGVRTVKRILVISLVHSRQQQLAGPRVRNEMMLINEPYEVFAIDTNQRRPE